MTGGTPEVRSDKDIPKISQRYPKDIPKISQRYPKDIPKISQRYLKDVPKISPRYPQDIYFELIYLLFLDQFIEGKNLPLFHKM